jgi:uncharacterized membrane protein YbhN (UPF0104 family)
VEHSRRQHILKSFGLWAISVGFAAFMLWVLVSQIETAQLAELFAATSISGLLGVMVAYLITTWFRAARFRLLLGPCTKTASWYRLTILHNFYFTFIPFKMGEASFIPLVKKKGISLSHAAPALILGRIYELASIVLFAIIGSLGIQSELSLWPIIVLMVLLTLFIFKFQYVTGLALAVLNFLRKRSNCVFLGNVQKKLEESHQWIINSKNKSVSLFIQSLLVTLSGSFSLYICFDAMGLAFGFLESVFLFTGMMLIGILGVFTIAGIGVSEVGLAGLLVLTGYTLEEAIPIALVARLYLLVITMATTALVDVANKLQFFQSHS